MSTWEEMVVNVRLRSKGSGPGWALHPQREHWGHMCDHEAKASPTRFLLIPSLRLPSPPLRPRSPARHGDLGPWQHQLLPAGQSSALPRALGGPWFAQGCPISSPPAKDLYDRVITLPSWAAKLGLVGKGSACEN